MSQGQRGRSVDALRSHSIGHQQHRADAALTMEMRKRAPLDPQYFSREILIDALAQE
jgi:hypothetical protein